MTHRYFTLEAAPPAGSTWMTRVRRPDGSDPLAGYGNDEQEARAAAFDQLKAAPVGTVVWLYERVGTSWYHRYHFRVVATEPRTDHAVWYDFEERTWKS